MKIVQKINLDFLQSELDKLIKDLNEFKRNANKKAVSQIDSLVLRPQEIQTMKEWIVDGEPKEIAFELIYRGSRDGFQKEISDSRLQGKGPTLTLVETVEHSQRFGGFTMNPWKFDD